MRKIIFCNNCWMKEYKGVNANDIPYGGGSYYANWKHEQFNFMEQNGFCYGYVQPTNDKIDLTRIDATATPTDEKVDDVLVVFTAPKEEDKCSYIVGWYNHATVYTESQPRMGYTHFSYYFKANVDDCTLIPEKERNIKWKFRRSPQYGEGYMGRSHVWYGDPTVLKYGQEKAKEITDFVEAIIKKIENYNKLA